MVFSLCRGVDRACGYFANAGCVLHSGLRPLALNLAWQIASINIADPESCLKVFARIAMPA